MKNFVMCNIKALCCFQQRANLNRGTTFFRCMCILIHPLTGMGRVCLLYSADRFKSYLPYLLSRDISQPLDLPLWRRRMTYSSFSLPFRFVPPIIYAIKKFCQEEAQKNSLIKKLHICPLFKSWRTSTPAEDHVEEVSSFLLRRKNDDH